MSKSIRISEENYKKLTSIGKGKFDDKFSTLLDKHQQSLINQSKPSAVTFTEPPTDYILGLILWYYYKLDKDKDPLSLIYEDSFRSRKSLRNEIEKMTKETGWHNEYPLFFTDMRNTKGRFQKKLDNCLELLVRNKVLERIEQGYMLAIVPKNDDEVARLRALNYLTVTDAPPKIYYKQNQKRKTFSDGSPVPSIDLHLVRI